jgi:hypothetical protein
LQLLLSQLLCTWSGGSGWSNSLICEAEQCSTQYAAVNTTDDLVGNSHYQEPLHEQTTMRTQQEHSTAQQTGGECCILREAALQALLAASLL